jgi:hypothetical protein
VPLLLLHDTDFLLFEDFKACELKGLAAEHSKDRLNLLIEFE